MPTVFIIKDLFLLHLTSSHTYDGANKNFIFVSHMFLTVILRPRRTTLTSFLRGLLRSTKLYDDMYASC